MCQALPLLLGAVDVKINTPCPQKAYALMERIAKPTASYSTV